MEDLSSELGRQQISAVLVDRLKLDGRVVKLERYRDHLVDPGYVDTGELFSWLDQSRLQPVIQGFRLREGRWFLF